MHVFYHGLMCIPHRNIPKLMCVWVSESYWSNWSLCVEINLTPEALRLVIVPLGLLCYCYWLCSFFAHFFPSLKLVVAFSLMGAKHFVLQMKIITE